MLMKLCVDRVQSIVKYARNLGAVSSKNFIITQGLLETDFNIRRYLSHTVTKL